MSQIIKYTTSNKAREGSTSIIIFLISLKPVCPKRSINRAEVESVRVWHGYESSQDFIRFSSGKWQMFVLPRMPGSYHEIYISYQLGNIYEIHNDFYPLLVYLIIFSFFSSDEAFVRVSVMKSDSVELISTIVGG